MNLRPRDLVALLGCTLAVAVFGSTLTVAASAQQTTLPLWPHTLPEPAPSPDPETDTTKPTDGLFNGHRSPRITNVSQPTLAVYPPHGKNTGAAALVFPGGAYRILTMKGEGTDTCDWLNSVGMTCLLVKYRVPQPSGAPGHYPADPADLEDAQQAMRLTRAHASEWHIDPHKIGVVGFSAGGNLAVLLSTHPDDHHVESTPAAADVTSTLDARANFAVVVYPAYLAVPPEETTLDPVYTPNTFTPPTFIIQAENDKGYGHNGLVYYRALMDAKVPAQLHYYASGGHGFGVDPVGKPEAHWTELVNTWMRAIGVIPALPSSDEAGPATGVSTPTTTPCPIPQPPNPGNPNNQPAAQQPPNPNCPQ